LRIGTEVVVTFPPERVVAAMAPIPEAPPIAAANEPDRVPNEPDRLSRRPLFRAGT
jgi:two-component system cell cycle sensor histidine kinase PleC